MLEELKKAVYEANMLLPKYNLVTYARSMGNQLGAGRKRNPMLRNHPCRLHVRRNPVRALPDKRRDQYGV